jgi:hypothetical protein
MPAKFKNGGWDPVLEPSRLEGKICHSQIEVAEAMPKWLGTDNMMLNEVELKTRDKSHIEVRELCRVLDCTVAELDEAAGALESGRRLPVSGKRRKR